jgi:hypothetical protein
MRQTLLTFIAVLFTISIPASYAQHKGEVLVPDEAERLIYSKALAAILERDYIEVKAIGYGEREGNAERAAEAIAEEELIKFITGRNWTSCVKS